VIASGRVHFHGLIAKPDGSACLDVARDGAVHDAAALGADAGEDVKRRAGPNFFAP
jgi:hydroxymethylbilane synthase